MIPKMSSSGQSGNSEFVHQFWSQPNHQLNQSSNGEYYLQWEVYVVDFIPIVISCSAKHLMKIVDQHQIVLLLSFMCTVKDKDF